MSIKSNVEELAITAVQLVKANRSDNARQYSVEVLDIVKKHPEVLLTIKKNGLFGKSFLLMFEQKVSDEQDDLQLITELSYYFISKAIEENFVKFQFILDRIILLFNSEDFLKDTIKNTLELKVDYINSLQSPHMIRHRLTYNLNLMRVSDLEDQEANYTHIDFLNQKKAEFDELFQRGEYFGEKKTRDDIIEMGKSLHLKVFTYIENKIKTRIAEVNTSNGTDAMNVDELELEFTFYSSDHLRYENGIHVSGPHGGALRAVQVERNINGGEGYTVTMFNTDGGQNVVQMAPKQMKLVSLGEKKIVLRGYGRDKMGSSFSDYGLTIFHDKGRIEKIMLQMHDRNIDIEYMP